VAHVTIEQGIFATYSTLYLCALNTLLFFFL
jgi:hypothetical protein